MSKRDNNSFMEKFMMYMGLVMLYVTIVHIVPVGLNKPLNRSIIIAISTTYIPFACWYFYHTFKNNSQTDLLGDSFTQLIKEIFVQQFKNENYSPLICLILYEKSQKGKFSYEEIYQEIAEKFEALNKEIPLKALTQLRECLDKMISEGYLNEYAGEYYPTGKKNI